MEKIKFSDKKYYLFKLFGPIAAIVLVIVLLFGPFFLDKKIVNASETEEEKYIFNDIYYNLSNNVFGFGATLAKLLIILLKAVPFAGKSFVIYSAEPLILASSTSDKYLLRLSLAASSVAFS